MPAVHLMGGSDTGHGCHPPRPNVAGSPNVFVEKKQVHRVRDKWAPHCCGPECHASELAEGSMTVFINGMGCGRIGDKVGCGSVCADGASTVFAGG